MIFNVKFKTKHVCKGRNRFWWRLCKSIQTSTGQWKYSKAQNPWTISFQGLNLLLAIPAFAPSNCTAAVAQLLFYLGNHPRTPRCEVMHSHPPGWVERGLRAHSCGHMQPHEIQSWEGHRMASRHLGLDSFTKNTLNQKLQKKWIKHQRWPTAETSFFYPGIWKELI